MPFRALRGVSEASYHAKMAGTTGGSWAALGTSLD